MMVGLARGLNRVLFRSWENPSIPLGSDDERLYDLLGGERSTSGVRITRESALKYSPVWRALNLISRDTAKCRVNLWEVDTDGKRTLDKQHPTSKRLRRKPNSFQTPFVWKQMMKFHELFYGNAYSYIKRNRMGEAVELVPLFPDVTQPVMSKGSLVYVTEINGKEYTLFPENVLHFKAISYDGLVGYGILAKARDSIGAGRAMQLFASFFFRNNAQPSGVLKHPSTLSDDAFQRLKDSWVDRGGGLENAHKPKILEEGMEWVQMGINAKDAQLIEGRKFDLIDVANWFNLPPHKLGDSSRLAYNSLEQENQSYFDDAIDPGFVNWEEEFEEKLLTENEKETESREIEFDRKSLARANMKDRAEKNRISLGGNPWRSVNEVRRDDGLDPIDDEWADEVPRPKNMNTGDPTLMDPVLNDPASKGDPQPTPVDDEKVDEENQSRELVRRALRGIVLDTSRRMVKRLCVHARKASRTPATFNTWLDQLRSDHSVTISEAFGPVEELFRAHGVDLFDCSLWICHEVRESLNEASGRLQRSEFELGVGSTCDRLEETLPAGVVEAVNQLFEAKG